MRGRGWFGVWRGRGMGIGRGMGMGGGWFGLGRGLGWWATPYAGYHAATIPYMGYGYPGYGVYRPPYLPYRRW